MDLERLDIGITGARGFIGTHLIKALRKNASLNLVPFEGDLLNKRDVSAFFENNPGLKQLVHLAGGFFGNFEELLSINLVTTNNLLEQGVRAGLEKIIFASTGAVYGEPINDKSHENDALHPNTIYGLTKMYAERCIQFYADTHDIKYIILRFSNVYGPSNKKGVIYNFLKSIKEKHSVTIFGDGKQKRNFLYVSDAVKAIIKALEYDESSQIINIADKDLYDLNEIVKTLKVLELDFEVEYAPASKMNSLQILSEDIRKAKAILSWSPLVSCKEGMQKTMGFWKNSVI